MGDLEASLAKIWAERERAYHEMDMGRSHWVSIQQFQQNTSRPIGRQRVRSRFQAVEVVLSILVGLELSTQVVVRLVVWVLEIVFSVRRCLPDIDYSTWNSLSGQ